jgi:cytoskeleton protein RodZ
MTDRAPGVSDADATAAAAPADAARSAGALLRAAREREGLHLGVLAATIKVAPAKLEALEQDRYADLPNATFTRALAQSVCRSLKIDPRPVLALLPQFETASLEGSLGKLNAPFHDRPSRGDANGLAWASRPMFWAGGLLLLAAVVIALLPPDLFDGWRAPAADSSRVEVSVPGLAAQQEPAASAVALGASAPPAAASAPAPGLPAAASASLAPSTSPSTPPLGVTGLPAPLHGGAVSGAATAAPAAVPAASPSPVPAAPPSGLLQLAARSDSWIEVVDGRDQIVFSRVLPAGERLGLDATPPLRLRIGNAAATVVTFRGQAQDLSPYTRDNVARLELR